MTCISYLYGRYINSLSLFYIVKLSISITLIITVLSLFGVSLSLARSILGPTDAPKDTSLFLYIVFWIALDGLALLLGAKVAGVRKKSVEDEGRAG